MSKQTQADAMQPRSAPKRPENRRFPPLHGVRRILLAICGAGAICVGLYSAAAIYGAPWLVDRWLGQYRTAAPGRTASRETIRFNPFTLVGEIVGLETSDAETGTSAAADRLIVDLAAVSMLTLRPVISSVEVERPRIEMASVAELSELARHAQSALPGGMRVDRLALIDGAFAVGAGADRTLELQRLDFTLTGLDGRDANAARFTLDAVTAAGGTVGIAGMLAADLEAADGRLTFGAIELGAVASRLGGIIGAVEPRGRIDLSAGFAARQLLGAPTLTLTDASLAFAELSLSVAPELTVTATGTAAATGLLLAANAGDGLAISGRIETEAARVSIRDARASPPQSFVFDDAAVLASTDDDGLSLILGGSLSGAGAASVTLQAPPTPAARRVSIEATDLPATLLSAYAADALGRRLTAGSADLDLDYSLSDGRGEGSLRLTAHDLEFAGPAAADSEAGRPSLELAAALLENAAGVIELDLGFATGTGTVRNAVADALAARIAAVTETPFDALAALADGAAQPASAVPFLPGDAALGDRALASVDGLAAALLARPRLGIRVSGGFDAVADRDALARQQIELHVALATAGAGERARPAPVDFGSPRAQDVLDEFAGERLPASRVAALAERFSCEGALADVCRRVYYERIFAALVANEEIRPTTLSRLGRFRAQSIADALRQRGIADERIELATSNDVVATPFGIGLPVELTASAATP